MSVHYEINQAEVAALIRPGGMVYQGAARAAGVARDRAKENLTQAGRVDAGTLRNSIRSEVVEQTSDRVTFQVGSDLPYAIFVERGTGLYGPYHSLIYPRRARVLRFQPSGSATTVFAASVRGMEGARYLERAAYSLTPQDFAA